MNIQHDTVRRVARVVREEAWSGPTQLRTAKGSTRLSEHVIREVATILREAATAEITRKSYAPQAKRHAAKWLLEAVLSPEEPTRE